MKENNEHFFRSCVLSRQDEGAKGGVPPLRTHTRFALRAAATEETEVRTEPVSTAVCCMQLCGTDKAV